MIEERVARLLGETEYNGLGERVTLVAATKTRTPDEINRAIRAGITDIGENRVQEFCDKYSLIDGARRHFIGRLQTNKVKFLIGKTFLIHSVDRDALASELAERSVRAGLTTDILAEINVGDPKKGGYPAGEGLGAVRRLDALAGISVKGVMAMLPLSDDTALLHALARQMRELFERAREAVPTVKYLSMGMSGDFRLCLEEGANMIRLGTALFGERT